MPRPSVTWCQLKTRSVDSLQAQSQRDQDPVCVRSDQHRAGTSCQDAPVLLYQVSGDSLALEADGQGAPSTTRTAISTEKEQIMQTKNFIRTFWTLGGGVLVAGLLAVSGPCFATEQAQERREGRDVKQDSKQAARQNKVDCKQESNKSNAECRQDKRDTKQEGREQKRDIKH
jgi:hypothetical protein